MKTFLSNLIQPDLSRFVYLLCLLLTVAPWLINIGTVISHPDSLIMESTVFSFDYVSFFTDFWCEFSCFSAGTHNVFSVAYAPFYAILLGAETLLYNKSVAYLVVICTIYGIAYAALFQVFVALSRFGDTSSEKPQHEFKLYSAVLALLYFSSLANFIYIKSTIFMTLPYLSLPIQLCCITRYIETGSRRYLLGVLTSSFFLDTFNITYFVYVTSAVNLYMLAYICLRRPTGLRWCQTYVHFIRLNVSYLPSALLVLTSVIFSFMYAGDHLDAAVAAVSEGMYSQQASILNILRQTTNWALFDGWGGKSYYTFSHFYEHPLVIIVGFVPWAIMLIMLVRVRPKEYRSTMFIFACLSMLLIVIFLQLGSNTPLLKFLFDHVLVFNIFRNVTKLMPLMLLLLMLLMLLLMAQPSNCKLRRLLMALLVIGGMGYNLPYWLYANEFISERFVARLPAEWAESSHYINKMLDPDSHLLVLPATYINDTYLWNDKPVLIMGNLPDAFWKVNSTRLSPILIGDYDLQKRLHPLFIPSSLNPRGLEIDYGELKKLLRDHLFDYVAVTEDMKSEYQSIPEIRRALKEAGFMLHMQFGKIALYHGVTPKTKTDALKPVARINGLGYVFRFKASGSVRLTIPSPPNSNWQLIIVNDPVTLRNCTASCDTNMLITVWQEIANLFAPQVVPDHVTKNHHGEIVWEIDPSKYGMDGDVVLVAFFRAQALFLLAICLILTSFFLAIIYLLWPRRKHEDGRKNLYLKGVSSG